MICAFLLARHLCMPRQLIEETLDSSGHPLTTSTSLLRDIVLPPSLFSKLLASLSASAPSAGRSGSKRSYLSHKGVVTRGQTLTHSLGAASINSATGAFTSPISWRKPGLRYAHNEILFDVTEEMRGIVARCVILAIWA